MKKQNTISFIEALKIYPNLKKQNVFIAFDKDKKTIFAENTKNEILVDIQLAELNVNDFEIYRIIKGERCLITMWYWNAANCLLKETFENNYEVAIFLKKDIKPKLISWEYEDSNESK